jgi:hypothetical protein
VIVLVMHLKKKKLIRKWSNLHQTVNGIVLIPTTKAATALIVKVTFGKTRGFLFPFFVTTKINLFQMPN